MYLDRRWLHKNSSKFSCFTSPTESLYLLIYFWQKSLHICFSILCIAFQLTVSWRDWRQIHCCLLHSRCISTHSLTKRLTAIYNNPNIKTAKFFIIFSQSPSFSFLKSFLFYFHHKNYIHVLWCESPKNFCELHIRIQNIRVSSLTSNPGLAPICSTLFLYLSPK